VVAGLTSLRSLVHQSFLPALERCGVVLSRLLGIARFHSPEEGVGFDEPQITKLLDIVACLTLVGHKILATVMDELDHFYSFSIWLRLEIDRQSSGASEELTEKEATLDIPKVLTYIQHYLVNSPLTVFFSEVSKEDYAKDQGLVAPGISLLDLLDKQLREHEAGRPSMKVLPRVAFLLNYLSTKAGAVSQGIGEAAKRRVRFGQLTELSVGRKIRRHSIWMGPVRERVCLWFDRVAVFFQSMLTQHSQDQIATVFTAMTPEDDKSQRTCQLHALNLHGAWVN
jgi:anaphase-promoting complex subunit 4